MGHGKRIVELLDLLEKRVDYVKQLWVHDPNLACQTLERMGVTVSTLGCLLCDEILGPATIDPMPR